MWPLGHMRVSAWGVRRECVYRLTGRRASVAGEGEHVAVRSHASKCVGGAPNKSAAGASLRAAGVLYVAWRLSAFEGGTFIFYQVLEVDIMSGRQG